MSYIKTSDVENKIRALSLNNGTVKDWGILGFWLGMDWEFLVGNF
jgi:hypothetical protein